MYENYSIAPKRYTSRAVAERVTRGGLTINLDIVSLSMRRCQITVRQSIWCSFLKPFAAIKFFPACFRSLYLDCSRGITNPQAHNEGNTSHKERNGAIVLARRGPNSQRQLQVIVSGQKLISLVFRLLRQFRLEVNDRVVQPHAQRHLRKYQATSRVEYIS